MSNFKLSGHNVTKIKILQKIGHEFGAVDITITSQYEDEEPETFTVNGYVKGGKTVLIEQSIDTWGVKHKIKELQANKE